MNFNRDRVRSIGWMFVLMVCLGLTLVLMVRVNAMKSQVRLAERQLVALKREKVFLETEFETRSNQQQLRALNDVEFGYSAPTAGQYLSGERQLASLGKAAAPDAPAPIRVASAMADNSGPFPAMVSPLSGKAMAAEPDGKPSNRKPVDTASLSRRLSRIPAQEVIRE
ncbi:MAG: hypothetical protein ABIM50_03930 [Novosphingobium sp.]